VHESTIARLRGAGCVFAEDEARLLHESAHSADELETMVARREAGTPLEHIIGWAEFCGLRICVEPGVFVPRRRSEFLVENAVALAQPGAVVVDLCCGTGALGAALIAAVPTVQLHAVEIDPAAVHCARQNLPDAQVYQGDLYEPLPEVLCGRVDIVVANAPYVPTEAISLMPVEARDYEHRVALDGGTDGLDIQRRVITDATRWLVPGGHILVETSENQAEATTGVMQSCGLVACVCTDGDRDSTIAIATARRRTAP
jgi:release factor glutamine methyltransferase